MRQPPGDPVARIEHLLAEFDGTERMAAEIRRAMLHTARRLPADHPVCNTFDSIAADLTIAVFVMAPDQAAMPTRRPWSNGGSA